ncbi:anti-sigma F factor [Planctomycetes bacterium Poly30]|uniref:Anti-sigma F factor n=1 Tax=Saltatorellus ferox TaxID=2528018 RepID=A0A518ELN2_9BACT|nr:anti-sigma F factor [Planctomycetes bacterium Poly30]
MSSRTTDQRAVLLALSDTTVALAFARILDARSHSSIVAECALEVLEGEPSDTFIADLSSTPSEDFAIGGLDLLEDLHSLGLYPHAILIAGAETTTSDYQRAARLGVDVILERPLRPEALVEAVEAPRTEPDRPMTRYVERGLGSASSGMHILLAAEHGAAEAAARDLIGWCARCEIVPSTRARIGTSVAETIQNCVDHGAQQIELTACLDRSMLTVTIEDDGPGFEAVRYLSADALDASSGLGRMHSLAENVSVRSELGGGTAVTLEFRVTTADFEDGVRIDLSELDFFSPETSKELLATLSEDPDAPVILSPALAVVVGRMLMGPDPSRVLSEALWS